MRLFFCKLYPRAERAGTGGTPPVVSALWALGRSHTPLFWSRLCFAVQPRLTKGSSMFQDVEGVLLQGARERKLGRVLDTRERSPRHRFGERWSESAVKATGAPFGGCSLHTGAQVLPRIRRLAKSLCIGLLRSFVLAESVLERCLSIHTSRIALRRVISLPFRLRS